MTPAEFEWADEQAERAYRSGAIGKIEFLKRMKDLGYGPQYLLHLMDCIDRSSAAITADKHGSET